MPFDEDVSALPATFNNTIPVPGLWDLAEKPFEYTKERETLKGNYDEVALWYKKTITFDGEVPARVTLKIHKAFWGKYVYVNGEFVAEHQPNFTPAYIDITDYLVGNGQENTLLIKIGDKGTQAFSSGTPTGYDPEKESFIPGIYDESLIDRQVMIDSEEAIDMAREIIAREGIFAGMSSGAAMLAARRTAESIERGNIVVLFADRAEKYLSTKMFEPFDD
jgi:hypothetical protein